MHGNEKLGRACPSARAEPGNLLYGRINGDRVERLGTPIELDQSFVDAVSANGPPEQRFRFAGSCVEGDCAQWTGSECGVIKRVLRDIAPEAGSTPLPRCSLRPICRWHGQEGAHACAACSFVVTDRREPIGATAV